MATLDDKLLGEKTQNYCSSSEGEDDPEEDTPVGEMAHKSTFTAEANINPSQATEGGKWQGYSKNTGPKGVLRDWQLFKEHEEQARIAKEQELIALCTQNAMTCRTEAEDARVKDLEEAESGDIDELLTDDILQDFLKKRMETMIKTQNPGEFGDLEEITSGEHYLKTLEDTSEKVTVVLHLYENSTPECIKMNECLSSLTTSYQTVKFCKMKASVAGVSSLFKKEAVPALLVYKGGNLIGNFIRLKEEFGSEFYAGDVENFLIERGILQDPSNISILMKEKCTFSS